MSIFSKSDIDAMTQEEAREWLIENDREGAAYWRDLPDSTDFKAAVLEDCESFGYDEPAKPHHQTNEEFVKEIMNFSKFGALSQMFVIDALDKHSKAVSEADPAVFDNAFMNGEAWVGVAKEIRTKLDAKYGKEK